MKNIFLIIILFASHNIILSQDNQNNIFLDREFWKSKPTIELVKAKINEGNDPAEQDDFGFDAVSYAIIDNSSVETIKFLLTLDGNPITKKTHGNITYLLWSAYKGNVPLIKYLIELGSDIEFTTARGTNILLMSGFGGQQDTLLYDYFLSKGVNINSNNSSKMNILLALAGSDAKDKNTFDYLINKGLDWHYKDDENNGFFHYAARAGNIENMKLALKENIDYNLCNSNGENAMFFASYGRKRSEIILKTLTFLDSLGLKVNVVNNKEETPLHHAVKRGNAEVIEFFLNHGIDVNKIDENGNTAFTNSVFGKLENMQILYPLINDINLKNNDGHSALSKSVIYAKKDAFNFLTKNGANLNIEDKNKDDLISLAFKNHIDRKDEDYEYIINNLVEMGVTAKPNYSEGNSLLHYAVEKNSKFLVKKALELNVDPNYKNQLGLTSLHLAAMKATNSFITEILIEAGADKNILTDFGESPYDLASENEILISNKTDITHLQIKD